MLTTAEINTLAKTETVGEPLSYREFKKNSLDSLAPGMIIKGVSPSRLFASQEWVDPKKIKNALNIPIPADKTLIVPAYVSFVKDKKTGNKQRVLVLGDGHTHTLNMWEQGRKVDVRIVGTLPEGNHIGFSVLRHKAGSPFRENV